MNKNYIIIGAILIIVFLVMTQKKGTGAPQEPVAPVE